jgi:glutathionyl-hydroquinone reductase
MGHFVDGEWRSGWYASDKKGEFVRPDTTFRKPLQAEALQRGDYLLFVSLACPWAHRTLIARSVLGFQEQLHVAVVDWLLDDNGWAFNPQRAGATPDPVMNARYLREIYLQADPRYTGRVTVPICWDKTQGTIVNNESREILRQLSTLGRDRYDLAPESLRPQIDAAIDKMYPTINNGVYRAGFASSQEAYDKAVTELFAALDEWEALLDKQPFAAGERFSDADVCLFTTLLRFDPVYHVHFKCSRRRISEYPNLSNYLRSLYSLPGVAETCNLEHIRGHYYASHRHINPTGIIAVYPEDDLRAPHDRWERFPQAQRPATATR